MIKRTLSILIISALMGCYLNAQTLLVFQTELNIHPQASNRAGCVFNIPNLNQTFDVNNNIKWEFNVQELTPTAEVDDYFKECINKQWSITFLDPNTNERLSAEKLSANENTISAQCLFNDVYLNLEVKITKKLNKQKVMYNEVSFKFPPHQIGLNAPDDLVIVLKMEKL